MEQISRDEVRHLAHLARLTLTDEEIDQYAAQIDGIVANVSAVQKVDTEGVEPMSHPHSITTAMRPDTVGPMLTPTEALDQAPDAEQERFKVPRILTEGD